ncbi:MAG: ferric reductase [Pseudomonadota bacterium]
MLALALVPLIVAGFSPLLQWRQPLYILAGFAGIAAMGVMLIQPLLAVGALPGVGPGPGRRLHRAMGGILVLAVLLHIGGLWITSPPDVIDVLLFRSPTPFGIWGALAMWAVFGAAIWAMFRRRLRLRLWRWGHTGLVAVAVVATVLHVIPVDGTMEVVTKWALSAGVLSATALAIYRRRVWASVAWRWPGLSIR